MLMDVPVQVHRNQFRNQPQVKKVFKAIPVQVKAIDGGHGNGGGGHGGGGWH